MATESDTLDRLEMGLYRVFQSGRGYEHLRHLRPGDSYTEPRTCRYNNTHFPLADEDDSNTRRNRKKTCKGQPVPWFERFGPQGIAGVHLRMAENRLR
jgi:hypothetical protein